MVSIYQQLANTKYVHLPTTWGCNFGFDESPESPWMLWEPHLLKYLPRAEINPIVLPIHDCNKLNSSTAGLRSKELGPISCGFLLDPMFSRKNVSWFWTMGMVMGQNQKLEQHCKKHWNAMECPPTELWGWLIFLNQARNHPHSGQI